MRVLDPRLRLDRPAARPAVRVDSGASVAVFIIACVLGVFALYWKTTASMIAIWARSDTFAHGFVVVPIFGYLIWRERGALARTVGQPCFPALIGVAVAGLLWCLAQRLSALGP